jgi:hypothetical protein
MYLNVFSKDRIGNLINELNDHFKKLNRCVENSTPGEITDIEFIHSFEKLKEIAGFGPYHYEHDYSSDRELGIKILESGITLFNMGIGPSKARKQVRDFSYLMLQKLYRFSYEVLIFLNRGKP